MKSRFTLVDLAVHNQIQIDEDTYIPRELFNALSSMYKTEIIEAFALQDISFKTWFPKLKEDLNAIQT